MLNLSNRFALPLLFLATCMTGRAQTATYRIAGAVIRQSDRAPLKAARVIIMPVLHTRQFVSTITDESGAFAFNGLEPGKYALRVTYRGTTQDFQQHEAYSTAIAVGPGLDSEHISFLMFSLGKISGSVRDEGEGIRGVSVQLFGQLRFNGRYQPAVLQESYTDDEGSFHFAHLPPGTYSIAVSGRPWYAQMGPGPPGIAPSDLDVIYPPTFLGPIRLDAGASYSVEPDVHAIPALHLTFDGVHLEPGQSQVITQLYEIGPEGILTRGLGFVMNGSEMFGVAPGEYLFEGSLGGQPVANYLGTQPLSLHGDTTVHLNAGLITSVSGKLIADGGSSGGTPSIFLREVTTGIERDAPVQPDGSFTVNLPEQGRYELLLANTNTLYMKTVSVKNARYADGILEIPRGAKVELNITAAAGLSSLAGVAVDSDKPVSAAMVLLLPQDRSRGDFIPRDQSDGDGTFTLNFIAPGDYTLIAIDDGDALEYANPALMKPYLASGIPIHIPRTDSTPVRVPVQHRSASDSPHN